MHWVKAPGLSVLIFLECILGISIKLCSKELKDINWRSANDNQLHSS